MMDWTKHGIIAGLGACCMVFYACQSGKQRPAYPETRKGEQADNYFGQTVADPYRWLENDTSTEVAAWVEQQNAHTFDYLSGIPYRQRLRQQLEDIWDYERVSVPFRAGDYYYFYKNDGLQDHSVLYRLRSWDDEPEVFVDPNTFSADGTTALAGAHFSKDGTRVGLLLSEGGADLQKAVMMDARTGTLIDDTLRHLKFTGITWRGNEGFYYGMYEQQAGKSVLSARTKYHGLYFHRIGTPQHEDSLVFGGEKQPYRYVGAQLTEDERFLLIYASRSTTGNQLYIRDLSDPTAPLKTLAEDIAYEYSLLASEGERLLLYTNYQAPLRKVVATSYANPDPAAWQDVIPEDTTAVLTPTAGGGKIFARYMVDVVPKVKQYDYAGRFEREVALPCCGTVYGFSAKREDSVLFYAYSSMTVPTSIYRYTPSTGASQVHMASRVDFASSAYEEKQVFYTSKDGTRIPMFIVHKKGLELDGNTPTYLYGYGGFNISILPSFSISRMLWLENGGIYAQPNIRGGGEYGDAWHLAGTRLKKQNVFDDFIAAAEYLIAEGYTSSERLAIAGRSNGGLLVGACMTQRPELFRVALPAVGVMDMLRYHTFTVGAGWSYDYGSAAESKEMFDYLYGYSPLHRLQEGVAYPATLVTTADHDDRVVPAHSYKFIATLQASHTGDAPVYIRIDTKAGHGAGKSTSMRMEEVADIYAFIWHNMGVDPFATSTP